MFGCFVLREYSHDDSFTPNIKKNLFDVYDDDDDHRRMVEYGE